MTTKKITVQTEERPISYLNAQGEEVKVGVLSSRTYQGENLTRYMLSKDSDDMSEASDAGLGRHELAAFLNHADVQRPMMDLGLQLRDITVGRGGTDLYSLWSYPEGHAPSVSDPITWDHSVWGAERQRYAGMPLEPGVIMQGTIRGGRGFTWQSAVLRLICTNGLTRWQGSGTIYKANGSTFSPTSLAEALFKLPESSSPVAGKNTGSRKGVKRTMRILEEILNSESTEEEQAAFLQNTPDVLLETLSPITRSPNWYTSGVLDQLALFYRNTDRDINALDVQNVVTNAINLPRFGPRNPEEEGAGHSFSRAFRMSSSLVTSVSNLIGIYSVAG